VKSLPHPFTPKEEEGEFGKGKEKKGTGICRSPYLTLHRHRPGEFIERKTPRGGGGMPVRMIFYSFSFTTGSLKGRGRGEKKKCGDGLSPRECREKGKKGERGEFLSYFTFLQYLHEGGEGGGEETRAGLCEYYYFFLFAATGERGKKEKIPKRKGTCSSPLLESGGKRGIGGKKKKEKRDDRKESHSFLSPYLSLFYLTQGEK